MIQATIRSMLLADEDVSAIVGDRIYDLQFPDGVTFPCIQIQRTSEVLDDVTFTRRTLLQIDAYSQSHREAAVLAEQILKALVNAEQAGDDTVFSVTLNGIRDLSIPETRLYRVTSDYAVKWRNI